MKKLSIIFISILILALLGISYWYFFMQTPTGTTDTGTNTPSTGFNPFNRPSTGTNTPDPGTSNVFPSASSTVQVPGKVPALRLLSSTPVGGYGASTTASTSIVRWVDRGRGNIFEAHGDTLDILTISNTVVPKIVTSIWNKNVTSFIASAFSDSTSGISNMYAELKARVQAPITASSTNSEFLSVSSTQYELKGRSLQDNIVAYAVSPKKDRIFIYTNEDGVGAGYISGFDGRNTKQIFTSPLTLVNVDWPEEKTIAITTRGTAGSYGYLYFVDTTTGVWKKIIGPSLGLSAKVSTDAKHVFTSISDNENKILTTIYNVAKGTSLDGVVRTLADKCIWGNFYKDVVYCGVPAGIDQRATYPDDWYKGTLTTADEIWQLNAVNGEVNLISGLDTPNERSIDSFNLGLDEKDNFLYFMNKDDLSLWSLDLVSGN